VLAIEEISLIEPPVIGKPANGLFESRES